MTLWGALAAVVIIALLFVSGLANGLIESDGPGPSPPSSPSFVQGQWWTYQIHTEIRFPNASVADEFIEVVVMSVSPTIMLNEVYYNANDRIPLINAYDVLSRQSLNNSAKSAWNWVTEAELADDVARIDERNATLTQTTATEWILNYSSPSNTSGYRFSRATGVLTNAQGVFSVPDATSTVTLINSGTGGQDIEQSPANSEGPYPAGFNFGYYHRIWRPPYIDAYWSSETYGYGVHSRHASSTADRLTGKFSQHAGAYAGYGYGGARAQARGVMVLPSAPYYSFNVGSTRDWYVESTVSLRAESYGAMSCIPPFGCAMSEAFIWLREEIFAAQTGTSLGLREVVVFDSPPIPWARTWYNGQLGVLFFVGRWYYLHANTQYYGHTTLHIKNVAAAVGVSIAYAHTHPVDAEVSQVNLGY